MASHAHDNDDHELERQTQAEIASQVVSKPETEPSRAPASDALSLPDGVDRVSVATGTFTSGDQVDPTSAQLIEEAVGGGQPSDQGESD